TPNRKLADGQQIMVSASGFAPDTSMAVVECPTSTVSPADCDLNTVNFTFTDGTGAYSGFPFTVSRILADGTDCALNGGCYIGTQDDQAVGPTAATLIKFDPNIPPLPPLEIAVRIDKTPSVNSKGVASLKGTVECRNRAANVEVDLDLRQIFDRAIFESFGFVGVSCSADTTVPFRATIRPQNGLFGPGDAVVRFQAFAGNVFVARRVAVTLHAKGAARSAAKPKLTWR
ncbi:MAG TPA: neocarzinostatin apoprotein domain-containing protein, partial [Acidimicrobiia bacterium]